MLAGLRSWVDGHKKATAAILGALVALVPDRYLDDSHKQLVVELAMSFILGQGAADFGKEKAKVEVAAGVVPLVTGPSERRTPRDLPAQTG